MKHNVQYSTDCTSRFTWRCAKNITFDASRTGKSLYDFFLSLPDYRCERKSNYSIAGMLTTLVVAMLLGYTSTYQAVHWLGTAMGTEVIAQLNIQFSRGRLPSYDTYSRMLRCLNHEYFAMEFINWMNQVLLPVNIHLSIDGKGLIGGTERVKGKRTPYALNVVEATTGLTIASIPIQEKTNEITCIPEILAWVAICSNMITIDAIGTQTEIIKTIVEQHGDYLLLVKKNNPEAYNSLTSYFTECRQKQEAAAKATVNKSASSEQSKVPNDHPKIEEVQLCDWQLEKGHSRMEYRRCILVHISSELENEDLILATLGANSALGSLEGCYRTIGMLECVRIPIERDEEGNDITPSLQEFLKNGSRAKSAVKVGDDEDSDHYKVGIISSRFLSPEEAIQIKRDHWSVENKLHHVLDVSLREDMSSAKSAKWNLSLLRKVVINLERLHILHGDAQDRHSMPCTGIDLGGDPCALKKFLFGNLPLIRMDK